ncbi:septum formation protein Maf [Synechococcus sp. KORDI-52]|uniref:Maf family protein n=1 Tax=Synechococcus sp. KORDI-52 TaxID=585425 RepID=UPI0004E08E2C|nr:Maf family protein [Synechococcus sp. KORDI-52]AII50066.1 septum formation protein Maf [Synechococcus sp. KORDI-52]
MLLLASASPARRRLLEQAGVPHRVRVSGVDEAQIHHPDPAELVTLLAQAKATAVALELDPARDAEITAVLGCDSVLSFEGQVFGKPSGPEEAIQRWQRMAGGRGSLLTGHCLIRRGQSDLLACVETVVRFAPLHQAEIEAYVASGEPLQCAGGFALEGRGGLCIDGLDGCYSNVIGLSLPWLRQALTAAELSEGDEAGLT